MSTEILADHNIPNSAPDIVIERRPHSALAPFVERLWFYRAGMVESCADWLLPHGRFELIVSLTGQSDQSLIAGPHTGPVLIEPASQRVLVGAHFGAGGAARYLGYAASEFRDLDVRLSDVWARRGRELHDALQGIVDPETALDIFEKHLLARLAKIRDGHPAVTNALDSLSSRHGCVPIGDLVAESGFSQRRFIQLFKEHVGLNPKLYARILRLQATLRDISSVDLPDWSGVAYENGYADQAHLIREFQSLAGMRPTEYRNRWQEYPGHVPAT